MATIKKTVAKDRNPARRVKPRDYVWVKWNETSKFHKAGTFSKVHRIQSEKMIERKVAELASKEEIANLEGKKSTDEEDFDE